MAEDYISRAKKRLILHLEQARSDHRADSLAFYEGIIAHHFTTPMEKLRARENVDKLLGLMIPPEPVKMQVEHSGGISQRNGRDVEIDVSVLPLNVDMKRKLLAMARGHEQEAQEAQEVGNDDDN
jgi:hypothetical protein